MTDEFSNEPISVAQLAELTDGDFVPVDPRYLWGRLAALATTAVVVFVGVALVAARVESLLVPVTIAVVLAALLALSAAVSVIEVRRLGYQLREHDVSVRRGAIRHSVESVPFARVQHVSTHRGPIERMLGLATLQVSSAGPDISIPGLAARDATRIKASITERTGVDEDESGIADERTSVDDDTPPRGAQRSAP